MEDLRLQKYISQAGICSRRKAEELILANRVEVNGVVINTLGTKVNPNDQVKVDGVLVSFEIKYYFLMNKPPRTVSTVKDDRDRRTVVDYFKDIPARLFPVGRLDYNTTGALVVTNDGELANLMMHPSANLSKIYQVEIDKDFNPEDKAQIEKGVLLEDGMTAPAELVIKAPRYLSITIHEGKNREVRRIFEHFGYLVKNLHRSHIAFLDVKDVKVGQYRPLKMEEIERMKTLCLHGKATNRR